MEYENYINTDFLVLVPVLYFIGMGLKKSKLRDKWIPIALGVIAIILVGIRLIATEDVMGKMALANFFFVAITQGILVAAASVYANQIFVQKNKEE